jgi:hypothetical protein
MVVDQDDDDRDRIWAGDEVDMTRPVLIKR